MPRRTFSILPGAAYLVTLQVGKIDLRDFIDKIAYNFKKDYSRAL